MPDAPTPAPPLIPRIALFAAVFVLVAGLVAWGGGEDTSAARAFLRELLRRLF